MIPNTNIKAMTARNSPITEVIRPALAYPSIVSPAFDNSANKIPRLPKISPP